MQCPCKEDIEAMQKDIADLKVMHSGIVAAFPAGDTKGHHDYHIALIERNKELRRLRMAIVEKTVGGLVWAVMLWAGVHIWKGVTQAISNAIRLQ